LGAQLEEAAVDIPKSGDVSARGGQLGAESELMNTRLSELSDNSELLENLPGNLETTKGLLKESWLSTLAAGLVEQEGGKVGVRCCAVKPLATIRAQLARPA
jgi:hypothetical protein